MWLQVFPTVEAPSQARRALSSLASQIDQRSLSDVRTVVSELVGMSVANGALEPIEVSLRIEKRCVEGAVHDDGAGIRAVGRGESALARRILRRLGRGMGSKRARETDLVPHGGPARLARDARPRTPASLAGRSRGPSQDSRRLGAPNNARSTAPSSRGRLVAR